MSANPLKYRIVTDQEINRVFSEHKNNPLLAYIKDLLSLIEYQRKSIADLNKIIVGLKHKEAWSHYDRSMKEYDPVNRKFIDKPPKSDNMSC